VATRVTLHDELLYRHGNATGGAWHAQDLCQQQQQHDLQQVTTSATSLYSTMSMDEGEETNTNPSFAISALKEMIIGNK